ncbi:type IV conjugative transfer system protein TraE (plasmid) [Rickettsiales bacterium Ac37b]|nr:type IV conjugative transfer system protein TraE [Rickettsiales bacterium Ac37b]
MQVINRKLRLQRNVLVCILGVMIISNSLLSLRIYSQDTVTRLVPTIDLEQIIGSKFVNDAALKARGDEIIGLIFSMRKDNAELIANQVLKQVDSSGYDDFKHNIEELVEDIRTRNYRYIFASSQGYEFDNHEPSVKVKGYLEGYIGGKCVSNSYKEYLISFYNRGGVLTLKSFSEVKDAKAI